MEEYQLKAKSREMMQMEKKKKEMGTCLKL